MFHHFFQLYAGKIQGLKFNVSPFSHGIVVVAFTCCILLVCQVFHTDWVRDFRGGFLVNWSVSNKTLDEAKLFWKDKGRTKYFQKTRDSLFEMRRDMICIYNFCRYIDMKLAKQRDVWRCVLSCDAWWEWNPRTHKTPPNFQTALGLKASWGGSTTINGKNKNIHTHNFPGSSRSRADGFYEFFFGRQLRRHSKIAEPTWLHKLRFNFFGLGGGVGFEIGAPSLDHP